MKRRPLSLMLLLSLLATAAYAGAKVATTRVFVNGLPLREQAIVQEGVTYVPMRAVAEALHCEVVWDQKTGVQIWGGQNPHPNDPTAPNADFNPYPRPVAPQAPRLGAPRPGP